MSIDTYSHRDIAKTILLTLRVKYLLSKAIFSPICRKNYKIKRIIKLSIKELL